MHKMTGQPEHNTRPHNRLPHSLLSMDDCMDDLTTGRSFDSQATWVIDVIGLFFLKCYPWLLVQPSNGRRPVDWCRNEMSVLYISSPKMHMRKLVILLN